MVLINRLSFAPGPTSLPRSYLAIQFSGQASFLLAGVQLFDALRPARTNEAAFKETIQSPAFRRGGVMAQRSNAGPSEVAWWQRGVVYQIYPRSFMDASGDGVGDLRGIVSRLDYLEWLGVDAVWISPFYPSPMADFGYDVSDYTGVDPLFGTLSDFDQLLEEAHRRGIRVILDYVPNHTSDEHPWFVESRSSRENPKRDWYIWRGPKPDGAPPNNWESYFGGSAWEWDELTGQYYLCLFTRKQPDLNWRNPEVRKAMYDVLRFWFGRGVDGFRIDVLWVLVKDERFRDNPENPDWKEGDWLLYRQNRVYSGDRPEVHEVVREMREVADEYGDKVLIGEIYLPLERLLMYYGEDLKGVHLPFNFQLVTMEGWDAQAVRRLVDDYEAALPEGAWPNWVLGNHDVPRIATRVGAESARLAAMLLLTLRGTPTLYYGDEIGMRDVEIPPEMVRDPQGIKSPGYGRDPVRTPMQWDAGPNAGFCPPDVEPWLPVAGDYATTNVETQRDNPDSMLSFVRRLLWLRNELPALTLGAYRPLEIGSDSVVAYLREHDESRVLVALNFGAESLAFPLGATGGELLLCSTRPDRAVFVRADSSLMLDPYEGVILSLG
jgi:alpha-glucosidase